MVAEVPFRNIPEVCLRASASPCLDIAIFRLCDIRTFENGAPSEGGSKSCIHILFYCTHYIKIDIIIYIHVCKQHIETDQEDLSLPAKEDSNLHEVSHCLAESKNATPTHLEKCSGLVALAQQSPRKFNHPLDSTLTPSSPARAEVTC